MAGKPAMSGRNRSCTSHTSSAVDSGLSLPTEGAALMARDWASTAAALLLPAVAGGEGRGERGDQLAGRRHVSPCGAGATIGGFAAPDHFLGRNRTHRDRR